MSEIPVPTDVRPSAIAGTWYPGDPQVLAESIDRYLEHASAAPPIPGRILGLIVPHAGHRYSGPIAAQAFKQVQGMRPETVVILSPLHALAAGEVLTSGHDAYATPLGIVPLDSELQSRFEDRLKRGHRIEAQQVRRDHEHALEIELPFLQRALQRPFRLLAVMLREQTERVVRAVSEALTEQLAPEKTLVVGSSDLSHFYTEENALSLDQEMMRRIESFKPQAVLEAETEGLGFACGRGAIAATMWTTRGLGADRVQVLKHATSADVTGDRSSVVGYVSAVIYRADEAGTDEN